MASGDSLEVGVGVEVLVRSLSGAVAVNVEVVAVFLRAVNV